MPQVRVRPSYTEACGLRHLAFTVGDLKAWVTHPGSLRIALESVRLDEHTGKRFMFLQDPDQLPLEIYGIKVLPVERPVSVSRAGPAPPPQRLGAEAPPAGVQAQRIRPPWPRAPAG